MLNVLKNRTSSTIFVSLFAACMLLLSGCSVVNDLQDIGSVGNAFLTALGKGDAAGAADLMHPRAKESGDITEGLKSSFIDRKFSLVSISNTKLENGVGELSGKCNLNDASGAPQVGDLTLQLQKDGDKWKVLNISCKIS